MAKKTKKSRHAGSRRDRPAPQRSVATAGASRCGGRATYGTYAHRRAGRGALSPVGISPTCCPQTIPNRPSSSRQALRSEECAATSGFVRWQEAKKARRSRVRVNKKRGGAESTAARDRACWSKWWAPVLGSRLPHMVTQRDIMAVIDSMEKAGLAPLTIKTHWSVIKAFFGWLFEEDVLTVSPIAKAWVSADAVLDRVRDIVVPDFRFIDMLSSRLGTGQDRVVFELLLGTGGRRSEVAGMMVGDVDLPAKRVWVRQPVVEVEGRLVRNPTPKGGRSRAVVVGPQLAQLLREHLMRMGMPAADAPLLTSAMGNGFRWNNYLARRLRPKICSTAVRWAVGERKRLARRGLEPSAGHG